MGALIEARSCERFARLAPELDKELGDFYSSLLKSEARHYSDYLRLAESLAGEGNLADRLSTSVVWKRSWYKAKTLSFGFIAARSRYSINR